MEMYERMNQLVLLAAALVIMLAADRVSGMDEPRAEALFDQQTCYLGDQVRFQIVIENVDHAIPPDLSNLPGAQFYYTGVSTKSNTIVTYENGRRRQHSTSQYVMQWTVTPNEQGVLTVPALRIDLDGGGFVETEQAELMVIEPEQASRPVLRFELEDDTLYVNQTTRLHITWLLVADVQNYSFRGNRPEESCTIRPAAPPRQGRSNTYQFEIFGFQAQGRLGEGMLDGKLVRTFEFDLLVTPTRAGEITIGPISVSYDERTSRRATRRVIAKTDPIVITALDLPAEGRPENFTGLLGTHDIKAEASPTDVNVGDPIEFTVTISGPEPMPGIVDGPDLEAIEGFTDDFRISSEGWTYKPSRRTGERTFSTTIRAIHDAVTEIPSIPLAFFDPGEGEYRIARSRPIPVSVESVREITAADAVVSSGSAAVSREPLTPTGAGLWAIDRGSVVLADTRGLSDDVLGNPVVLAALVVPPGVFALAAVLAMVRSRKEDESARRRRRALSSAKRALRRDGPARAVRVYLADAFGISPAAITGADGRRLLARAGLSEADAVAELLALYEAEHYASAGRVQPSGLDRDRTLELLCRIDRSIRRRS